MKKDNTNKIAILMLLMGCVYGCFYRRVLYYRVINSILDFLYVYVSIPLIYFSFTYLAFVLLFKEKAFCASVVEKKIIKSIRNLILAGWISFVVVVILKGRINFSWININKIVLGVLGGMTAFLKLGSNMQS